MSNTIFADEGARQETANVDDRPLTDEERQLLQRLLSDPFNIPMAFKTWLISFLEGSDLSLPRSSVQGLSGILGGGSGAGLLGILPAGLIFPYSGTAVPTGALLCDGGSKERGQYARLFAAIGTTYGSVDASHFNVPDYRRRTLMGTGAGIGLATNDGRAETNRHVKHHHFFQDTKTVNITGTAAGVGDHAHGLPGLTGQTFNMNPITNAQINFLQGIGSGSTHGAGGHSHSVSGSGSVAIAGDTSGAFDQDTPAFHAVAWLINY